MPHKNVKEKITGKSSRARNDAVEIVVSAGRINTLLFFILFLWKNFRIRSGFKGSTVVMFVFQYIAKLKYFYLRCENEQSFNKTFYFGNPFVTPPTASRLFNATRSLETLL